MGKYDVDLEIYNLNSYFEKDEIKFKLYKNCCISDVIKNGDIWEPHLHRVFEKYINKDSVVLEAGCHIGTHSIKLSKLSKKVICFEPLIQSYEILLENFKLNNCDNYTAYNEGLSNSSSNTRFAWITPGNVGASGLHDNPMGIIHGSISEDDNLNVKLRTIDDLSLDQLNFIKLDVEGYELKAIEGGIQTIKKFRPIITLECWSDHNGNASQEYTEEKFKILFDLNYKLERISHADWLFIPSII